MTKQTLVLTVAAMLLSVTVASAQNYKPTTPATGLWCNGKGTFVIRNGVFKYFRGGVLKYEATYRISGNKILKSGKKYAFFRNEAGAKFYRRDGHDEMIPVRRRCRYRNLS
jgi:hypothetical protein